MADNKAFDPHVFWVPLSSCLGFYSSVTAEDFRRSVERYGAVHLRMVDFFQKEDPAHVQWVDDCHVFCILQNTGMAMRKIPDDNRYRTVHNQFFWKAHHDAEAQLNTKETPNLWRDCRQHPSRDVFGFATISTPDPYMAHLLRYRLNLSSEASEVLYKLDSLWLKSLPQRESYALEKPELHLMAWDAGVHQLKGFWQDLFPSEWEDLQAASRRLSDKISRPGP